MITIDIVNNKNFMNALMKEDIFDNFEVRNIEINTFTKFEISGILNKSYFSLDEQETINRNFCLWKELKPIVFGLIKGSIKPKSIKIIFSYDTNKLEEFDNNASALFLNIVFEDNKIICTTGSSQKVFSLDRNVETKWDIYIGNFFNNEIKDL